MARLPQPGSDDGVWGDVLNTFLGVAHAADGSLKDDSILESKLDPSVRAKLNPATSSSVTSVSGRTGAVTLTKSDVGLANVDNTSDASKPISAAVQSALDTKADVTSVYTKAQIDTSLSAKTNTSSLASVATSGSYNDLADKPVIAGGPSSTDDVAEGTTNLYFTTARAAAAAAVQSVAGQTGAVTLTKSDVGLANVDNTADVAKPVSTATQTALDGKAALSHTHTAVQISDATAIGRTILTAADAAAVRTATGAGTSNLTLGTTSTTAAAGDHTHSNYLPIKNGISNVTDSTNDTFARVNITDDASNTANWPDRLAFYFSGTRSGYHNEYGELRARPAKSSTVALRAMKWATASTVDIFQVANTDATTLYFTVGPTSMTTIVPLTSTANISTTGTVSATNIGNKVTASSTPPASPAVGDVWVDLSA